MGNSLRSIAARLGCPAGSPQKTPKMGDIKILCPQCKQKIGVDDSAVGVKIDCPRCRSTLVIPPTADAPVEVVVRRRLAMISEQHEELHGVLEKKRQEADAAIATAAAAQAEIMTLKHGAAAAKNEIKAA